MLFYSDKWKYPTRIKNEFHGMLIIPIFINSNNIAIAMRRYLQFLPYSNRYTPEDYKHSKLKYDKCQNMYDVLFYY